MSPIVQIGADQKVNELTRVILDGSASYDPDPTGSIVSYKWKYVGQRTDVTITSESESIAYFTGPDISETTVMLFGLEVIDNDKTASYGSTTVTIVPVKKITACVSGGIEPKYPEDITLDSQVILPLSTTANTDATITVSSTTNLRAGMSVTGTGIPTCATIATITDTTHFELSAAATATGSDNVTLTFDETGSDGSKTLKLISGTTEIDMDMKIDGAVFGKVITEDGTESTVIVPLFADLHLNKDASISILMSPDNGTEKYINIKADGEVIVGIKSSGAGTNGIDSSEAVTN
jgi:hypothetical protein